MISPAFMKEVVEFKERIISNLLRQIYPVGTDQALQSMIEEQALHFKILPTGKEELWSREGKLGEFDLEFSQDEKGFHLKYKFNPTQNSDVSSS